MRGAKPFLTVSDEGTRKEQPPSDMVMKTNSPFMRILTALARVMTPEAVPSFPKPTSIRTIYHPVRSGVLAVLWLCGIAGNINAADFVAILLIGSQWPYWHSRTKRETRGRPTGAIPFH